MCEYNGPLAGKARTRGSVPSASAFVAATPFFIASSSLRDRNPEVFRSGRRLSSAPERFAWDCSQGATFPSVSLMLRRRCNANKKALGENDDRQAFGRSRSGDCCCRTPHARLMASIGDAGQRRCSLGRHSKSRARRQIPRPEVQTLPLARLLHGPLWLLHTHEAAIIGSFGGRGRAGYSRFARFVVPGKVSVAGGAGIVGAERGA
jgi:hypothetical protein